jgi:tripartite-type tricarboxylate transporter receptor subunit TctC
MKKLLVGLSLILAASVSAFAQDSVAEFYKGKTIRLVVGIAVGSGYDINARLLARHLGSHIPGNPTIVVQNQPGAGSMTMTQALFASGPFDGTVIGAAFGGMPTIPLLQRTGASVDPTKLLWIGNTNRETHVAYVWHTAPVQSLEQAKTKELVMGAQAPGSSQYDFPLVANDLFGYRFKVVSGYQSSGKILLAMESGEVQGMISAWTTLKAMKSDWLRDKQIKLIAQWSFEKHPELPDVPNMLDLAKNDADRAAMRLVMARLDIGRPFFVPPGVPAERVNALRRAFDATMKDPAYLAEADKLKIEVNPLTGEQLAALVEQVSRTPADIVARVRTAMEAK